MKLVLFQLRWSTHTCKKIRDWLWSHFIMELGSTIAATNCRACSSSCNDCITSFRHIALQKVFPNKKKRLVTSSPTRLNIVCKRRRSTTSDEIPKDFWMKMITSHFFKICPYIYIYIDFPSPCEIQPWGRICIPNVQGLPFLWSVLNLETQSRRTWCSLGFGHESCASLRLAGWLRAWWCSIRRNRISYLSSSRYTASTARQRARAT